MSKCTRVHNDSKEFAQVYSIVKQITSQKDIENASIYVFSQYDCNSCINGLGELIKADFNSDKQRYPVYGIFVSNTEYYNSLFDSLFKNTSFIMWHKTSDVELLNLIEKNIKTEFAPSLISIREKEVSKITKLYIRQ